ncbi:MAG TPA: glycosyltransferase family 4 protein [Xanthobacteraceae bacterium]|jgi:glycosyltransferase involved in cell wall biosynthesis|nr:glycosyltransferase family 4 protein [Xanthobacteraceae bacterium]
MRIGFLDTALQYTTETPYKSPLGGSQSALCYLAVELTRLGHAITIFNGLPGHNKSDGVEIRHISEINAAGSLKNFDIVVVINLACATQLRQAVGFDVPLVLWAHHAHDQPAMAALNHLGERKRWAGFAFVSCWQRDCYERQFSIRPEKIKVLRNAVSPAFANVSQAQPWFITGASPTLFYTSTPFRGLDVLIKAFPAIRNAVPGTRLRVYSSMAVYQVVPANDPFHDLYRQCQSMDGVEYVASIGQSRLAGELATAAALAYPSTFAETSCIAVLEAMAVGASIFTTRLGALPETTNGLAELLEAQSNVDSLAEGFATMTADALSEMQRNPSRAALRREERIRFIHDNYLWPSRAREWSLWLSQLAGRALSVP